MKFDCGPDEAEVRQTRYNRVQAKRKARGQWHRWFAWFPVQVGPHDCRWLEYVERKDDNIWYNFDFCTFTGDDRRKWEYRALNE